jgi:hypothetical protein
MGRRFGGKSLQLLPMFVACALVVLFTAAIVKLMLIQYRTTGHIISGVGYGLPALIQYFAYKIGTVWRKRMGSDPPWPFRSADEKYLRVYSWRTSVFPFAIVAGTARYFVALLAAATLYGALLPLRFVEFIRAKLFPGASGYLDVIAYGLSVVSIAIKLFVKH